MFKSDSNTLSHIWTADVKVSFRNNSLKITEWGHNRLAIRCGLSQSVNRLAKGWNIEGRLISGTEIFLSTITSRQLAYKVHLVGSEEHFSENMTVRVWS